MCVCVAAVYPPGPPGPPGHGTNMYGNVPGYEGSLAGGGELFSSLFHRLHTPAQGSGREGGVALNAEWAGGGGVVKKGRGQDSAMMFCDFSVLVTGKLAR